MLQTTILEKAKSLQKELVSVRRTIHQCPELAFQEKNTAAFVSDYLKKLGFDVKTNIAGTGVVAEIGKGRTVGIRADMDALPIQEENNFDYISKNEKVMHACGHDAHVACALGAATLIHDAIQKEKNAINGKVRFIFQPSEESVNEKGQTGAMLMLQEGAVNDLEALFSLHVYPGLKTGAIATKKEVLLAASDSFQIAIKGKGSHGAFPELGIDAVLLSANVIEAIQTIVSRRKSAVEPLIISIGGVRSKTFAPNIIAEEVELIGTVRYLNKDMHKFAKDEIAKACQVATALGGDFELKYNHDTPALFNDPQITEFLKSTAAGLLGKENVIDIDPQFGSDDFSYFSQKVPSCYFALGAEIVGDPKKLHTADFNIDENCLPIGTAVLTEAALRFLANPKN